MFFPRPTEPRVLKSRIRLLAASLICLSVLVSCTKSTSTSNTQPRSKTDESAPQTLPKSASAPHVMSPALARLSNRLKRITLETTALPGFTYGSVPRESASYVADEQDPEKVREVTFCAMVDWCDDGCICGPGKSPANDEDLLLLLPFAASLTSLDVRGTNITDAGLETIAQLPRLETLKLGITAINGSGLSHLKSLTRLKSLDLDQTDIPLEHWQSVSELKSLEYIELPSKAVNDDLLVPIGQLPLLKVLLLTNTPITDAGLAHLTSLKNLETLSLCFTKITDAGLSHLRELSQLQHLDLTGTNIQGSGLVHLAQATPPLTLELRAINMDDDGLKALKDVRQLVSLDVRSTHIRGPGLIHLKHCEQLKEIHLPPLTEDAIPAINEVKNWRQLNIQLVRPLHQSNDSAPPTEFLIEDMPELTQLSLETFVPIPRLTINNCPQLTKITFIQAEKPQVGSYRGSPQPLNLPATTIHLQDLPALAQLTLRGAIETIEGVETLPQLTRIACRGALNRQAISAINRCPELQALSLHVHEFHGSPLHAAELREMPLVEKATISLHTVESQWLVEFVSRMKSLQVLDLLSPRLTAIDLQPLSHCTHLQSLILHGIDDPGEPLVFINRLPNLEWCSIFCSPQVGRIRLTPETPLRRLIFQHGRLGKLEVRGAPRLQAIHLGREAKGNRADINSFPNLNLEELTITNAPQLKLLMVDAYHAKTPLRQVTIAETPKLTRLFLRGSPARVPRDSVSRRQGARTHFITDGTFPDLSERRLHLLQTDQNSLDRLNAAPLLRGGAISDVFVNNEDDPAR